ncbi:hypothetical protein P9139_16285 [Curtobacterium flaccumfaciens]|nr:hypothetical protein P9139_16285 [Curtobacterium flaccumfaciens]
MCGIIAARVADDATPYLLDGLERLEYRGYDSAGIAVRTAAGRTETIRSVSRVGDLRTLVAARSGDALTGVGIGHTRWATHGVVCETNAHPHADCSGRISIVHNGIVENADRLRATLEQQGHVFASDVDSEVIAHLVERALAVDPDLMLAVQIATAQLEGSWAVVVLDARDGRMVVAAERSRWSSPGRPAATSWRATSGRSPSGARRSWPCATATSSSSGRPGRGRPPVSPSRCRSRPRRRSPPARSTSATTRTTWRRRSRSSRRSSHRSSTGSPVVPRTGACGSVSGSRGSTGWPSSRAAPP